MMKFVSTLLLTTFLLCGCSVFTDDSRIKPGFVKSTPSGLIQKQSQDPKSPTDLEQESQTVLLPAGSVVTIGSNHVTLSSNSVYTVQKLSSHLGASQKNTLGLYAEKLKSLSWLTYLGALLVIFGIASAVYPPIRAIINSITTSAVITLTGILFILLPSLIVGREVLILCIGLGAAGLYWFAHRHGGLSATVSYLKSELESPASGSTPQK